MKCFECDRRWHSACVGLGGLTQSITIKIINWKCPQCFTFNAEIRDKLDRENIDMSQKDVIPENAPSSILKEIGLIKDILINQVVPNTNKIEAMAEKASNSVKETIDDNWLRQTQSWANLFINKQEETQRSLEQTITVQQKKVVTEAIDNSRQKMERDNVERDKRKRNVIIRELSESREVSNEAKRKDDKERVAEIMEGLDPKLITDVRRVGIPKRDHNRPLIITLSSPDLAAEMHNYGRGRRQVSRADNSLFYWINADLIQADRIANFNARTEARNRRQQRGRSSPNLRDTGDRPDYHTPDRRPDMYRNTQSSPRQTNNQFLEL